MHPKTGVLTMLAFTAACSDMPSLGFDAASFDAASPDAASPDAASPDAASPDAASPDAATIPAVTFGSPVLTAEFGGTGGTAFTDACPQGEALIGFAGSLTSPTGYHGKLNGVCGAVTISMTKSGYAVLVGTGTPLPSRGTLENTSWERTCAANQVLVGFAGRSGQLIDQLTFRCAPLTVSLSGATWSFVVDAANDLQSIGGEGGAAFDQTDCAVGAVATAVNLRAGDGIDRFGITCSVPTAN